ncbi:TIR domain-containing protein [Micrococcus luteus]|uniref:TIR domain-containing protein n=1 Tax=Micrococcus luteus TaxID=1270 RepID=UPI0013E8FA19|nr:TIR domain-containing protein [Micrococcus luteus]
MTVTDVRSRIFGRRDIRDLVVILAEGFTHAELTMHVDTYAIPDVPPDDGSNSKQKRATSMVRTLLKRGWPEGDEALLDLIHQSKNSRYASDSLNASRSTLDARLMDRGELVTPTMSGWKINLDGALSGPLISPSGENPVRVRDSDFDSASGPENEKRNPFAQVASSGGSVSPTGTPERGSVWGWRPNVDPGVPTRGMDAMREHALGPVSTPPKAFVVHGRDHFAAKAVRAFLRGVHIDILTWDEAKEMCNISPTTWEIVQKGVSTADIIIVVLSGDDQARLRPDLAGPSDPSWELSPELQPRQNVLLEAGMALGSAYEKTVLVRTQRLREISDLSGFHWVTMDGTPAARAAFLGQLKKALHAAGFADPLRDVPAMWDEEALGTFIGKPST